MKVLCIYQRFIEKGLYEVNLLLLEGDSESLSTSNKRCWDYQVVLDLGTRGLYELRKRGACLWGLHVGFSKISLQIAV